MKSIKVSDEAHSQLQAIAAYLTLQTKTSQSLGDAVDLVVEDFLKDHSIQLKQPIQFKKREQ